MDAFVATSSDLSGLLTGGVGALLALVFGLFSLYLIYKLLRTALAVIAVCFIASAVGAVFIGGASMVSTVAKEGLDVGPAFLAAGSVFSSVFGGTLLWGLNPAGAGLAFLAIAIGSVWLLGKVMCWMDLHFPRTALWLRSAPGRLFRLSGRDRPGGLYRSGAALGSEQLAVNEREGALGDAGPSFREATMEDQYDPAYDDVLFADAEGHPPADPPSGAPSGEESPWAAEQETLSFETPPAGSPPGTEEVVVERITYRRGSGR